MKLYFVYLFVLFLAECSASLLPCLVIKVEHNLAMVFYLGFFFWVSSNASLSRSEKEKTSLSLQYIPLVNKYNHILIDCLVMFCLLRLRGGGGHLFRGKKVKRWWWGPWHWHVGSEMCVFLTPLVVSSNSVFQEGLISSNLFLGLSRLITYLHKKKKMFLNILANHTPPLH